MGVSHVSFPVQIPDFHAKSLSLYAKVYVLLSKLTDFTRKYSSGYVHMSNIPSVCHVGWGVLCTQSALYETGLRGGLEWVSLRRCA